MSKCLTYYFKVCEKVTYEWCDDFLFPGGAVPKGGG